MNRPDRREEFKNVRWNQGRLLMTDHTRHWRKDQVEAAEEIERRTAFAYFTGHDEGRGREYVFQFGSRDECKAAVDWHNELLKSAD
jgi:hypothetical protein